MDLVNVVMDEVLSHDEVQIHATSNMTDRVGLPLRPRITIREIMQTTKIPASEISRKYLLAV